MSLDLDPFSCRDLTGFLSKTLNNDLKIVISHCDTIEQLTPQTLKTLLILNSCRAVSLERRPASDALLTTSAFTKASESRKKVLRPFRRHLTCCFTQNIVPEVPFRNSPLRMGVAMNASDVLVETLMEWGVDTIFGLPGDGINGVFEALRQRKDKIRFIQVRQDRKST